MCVLQIANKTKVIITMSFSFDLNEQEDGKTLELLPHPPTTFEEFLKQEHIEEWPQKLTSEGILDLSELELWTEEQIHNELTADVPYGFEVLDSLELSMSQFCSNLGDFTSAVVSAEQRPSRLMEKLFHAPRQDELDQLTNDDAVKLHPSYREKKKVDATQAIREAAQELKTKNVEHVSFPGFRSGELTELPSQLEAPQLLNKITGAQTFNAGFQVFWKKMFLSEASVALLQDTFWWVFLEHFEHNPTAQDSVFTRIADTYVALFFSVHTDVRDKFLQVFPECLAQAVYLTFCEAFPESLDQFNEGFLSDLCNLTSGWISGVAAPVDGWRKWPWAQMNCSPPGARLESRASVPRGEMQDTTISVAPPTITENDFIEFAEELNLLHASHNPPQHRPSKPQVQIIEPGDSNNTFPSEDAMKRTSTRETSVPPSTASLSKISSEQLLADSTFAGPGPDYERVLFNLQGRTPLVSHHLYMKQLKEKNKFVGQKMRRTEVTLQPSSGVTFEDVIARSKKKMKTIRGKIQQSELATENDILKCHSDFRKAAKEIETLRQSLTDPIDMKIRSDKVLDQALGKGFFRASTYSGAGPTSANTKICEDLLKENFE